MARTVPDYPVLAWLTFLSSRPPSNSFRKQFPVVLLTGPDFSTNGVGLSHLHIFCRVILVHSTVNLPNYLCFGCVILDSSVCRIYISYNLFYHSRLILATAGTFSYHAFLRCVYVGTCSPASSYLILFYFCFLRSCYRLLISLSPWRPGQVRSGHSGVIFLFS